MPTSATRTCTPLTGETTMTASQSQSQSPSAQCPPPRSIEGSVGSRIRLVLGKSGSEWLLILNEDDGIRQWQSYSWYGIPAGLADQLNNCRSRGLEIQSVAFGPTGAWFVKVKTSPIWDSQQHTRSSWWGNVSPESATFLEEESAEHSDLQVSFGSTLCDLETTVLLHEPNGYFPWRLPQELLSHMEKANNEGCTIDFCRLFHHDNYVISIDGCVEFGSEMNSVGTRINHELKKEEEKVEEIALSTNGSNHWIVIRRSTFVYSSEGIHESLLQRLRLFFREQLARNIKRQGEIRAHHARVAGEAVDHHVAEREAAIARRQAAEREHARHQAKQAAENAARVSELEKELEKRLVLEAKDIYSLEMQVHQLESHTRQRRRSLQASIRKMSTEQKARFQEEMRKNDSGNNNKTDAECVICHMEPPTRAIIPCGHYCLCEECAQTLTSLDRRSSRVCPLCRGVVKDTLKIFLSSSTNAE